MADDELEDIREILGKRSDRYRYDWLCELRDADDVNVSTKGILFVIGMACSGNGTGSYMRVSEIARRCNLQPRATSARIADALESGWIIRTRKGHKVGRGEGAFGTTSEYACVIPSLQEFADSEESSTGTDVQAGSSQHAESCDPACRNARPSMQDSAAEGVEENRKEPSARARAPREGDPFPDEGRDAKNGADRAREAVRNGTRSRREYFDELEAMRERGYC